MNKVTPAKAPVDLRVRCGPIELDDINELYLSQHVAMYYEQKAFYQAMNEKFNLPRSFCGSSEERTLCIDIRTGFPFRPSEEKIPKRDVTLTGGLIMYGLFESRSQDFRLAVLGCSDTTIFMVIKPDLAYSFVLDMPSMTPAEAVRNLYITNLNKGNGMYENTMGILPGLFYKLFAAVYPDDIILNFNIYHIKGALMNMRLYLAPQDPERCALSSNGWVFEVNLNEFPGKQISRGNNLRNKELRNKSR